jgi:hypothetical protein
LLIMLHEYSTPSARLIPIPAKVTRQPRFLIPVSCVYSPAIIFPSLPNF